MQPGVDTHIGLEPETLIIFAILAVLAFILDMLAHRGSRPISLKAAIAWSLFWIVVAMGFGGFLYWHFNFGVTSLFLAGYLFELALSVDNLFVMMAIFTWFHVNECYCHRVLYWGVLGAVVFRLLFVAVGASLFALGPVVEIFFGILVALSGVMMLRGRGEEQDSAMADLSNHIAYRMVHRLIPVYPKFLGCRFFLSRAEVEHELKQDANQGLNIARWGAWFCTPMFLCLAVIETTDVMFAFDSVPAVIAVSREPLIIYSAMIFAVLGLRSLYFVLNAMRRYLIHLEKAVVILLFFIAFKLFAGASLHLWGFGVDISVYISLAVIAVILGLGILASLVFPEKRSSAGS